MKKRKIRSDEDVELLAEQIRSELGIDVMKYKSDEVAASIGELIVFPQYVVTGIIRPIIVSFLFFLSGFLLPNLTGWENLLYLPIGLLLFLFNGVILGFLFLCFKLRHDVGSILRLALEIMKAAIKDASIVKDQFDEEDRKEKMQLLFQGVVHCVTIPLLAHGVASKIPLVGGLLKSWIIRSITFASGLVKFDELEYTEELENAEIKTVIEHEVEGIDFMITGIDRVLGAALGFSILPLIGTLIFSLPLLLLFIYYIN